MEISLCGGWGLDVASKAGDARDHKKIDIGQQGTSLETSRPTIAKLAEQPAYVSSRLSSNMDKWGTCSESDSTFQSVETEKGRSSTPAA